MALFKTSVFGGYNKKEVEAYIKQIKMSFSKRKTELEDQIKQYKAVIDELQKRVDVLNEQVEVYEAERQSMLSELGAQETEVKCLNGVITDLKAEIDELNEMINTLKSNSYEKNAEKITEISDYKIRKKSSNRITLKLKGKKRVGDRSYDDEFKIISPEHAVKVKVSDVKKY